MKRRTGLGVMFAASAMALGVGYWIGSARADGIPTMETLAYSGELTDGGAAATGSFTIGVSLWSDASSTTASFRECDTAAASTTVTSGHFRVPLDPTCVSAVRENPNLWAEVTVGGTRLTPRTHISAVPYAVEADHVAAVRATWIGVTPTSFTGNISFGGVPGYRGARAACQAAFPTHAAAHMCTSAELTLNAGIEDFPFTTTPLVRYAGGVNAAIEGGYRTDDCLGYTTASSSGLAAAWQTVMNRADNLYCSDSAAIVCCD